jgi:EpsD family peptidyl-prolyl cis-trans isomerase
LSSADFRLRIPLVSFRLSVLLAATLLASSLGLGGCSPSGADPSSQRVAEVNGEDISVHLLNQWIGQQAAAAGGPPPPEQTEALARAGVQRLIEQELLVQRAEAEKLDRDPQVLAALALARRDTLARAYAQRLAAGAGTPDNAAQRAWYDAHPLLFAERRVYELRETLLPVNAAQFDALRKLLEGGASFGDLGGWMQRERLPSQGSRSLQPAEALPAVWLEKLAAMRDGQALLLGSGGAARIVVRVGAVAAPLSFEQAQPAIAARLQAEARQRAVAEAVQALKRDAQVRLHGRFAQSAASAPQGAAATATAASGPASAAAFGRALQGLR